MNFRYQGLGYVALNVSDLARSLAFYRDIVGLQEAGNVGAGTVLLRCSDSHHDVVLHQASVPGLRRVGWEMASTADLAAINAHLHSVNLAPRAVAAAEAEALGVTTAVRVSEPHTGAVFEYFCTMARASSSYQPTVARIARLGHVVLTAADHAVTERFFREQLNFKVSDRIEGAVTFLRCFPNPLHHSLGLSKGSVNRLHHVNFMVTDIDDIGRALYRLRKHDVPIVFGPGRHPPSESIFLYFLDPDGLTLEYSFGMEEFSEVAPRAPRLLPFSVQSIDYWGAVPDPQFAVTGEIAPAEVGA